MKKGDLVIVTDSGRIFTTYSDWAEKYNVNNFERGLELKEGNVGILIQKAPHVSPCYGDICAVYFKGNEYLIGEDGLSLITEVTIDGETYQIDPDALEVLLLKSTKLS